MVFRLLIGAKRRPEIPGRRGANFITEVVGTAVLVFGVLAIAANASELSGGGIDLSAVFATGINPLLVGFLVWGIGLSLGGPTGYAINPARDLGPRCSTPTSPAPRFRTCWTSTTSTHGPRAVRSWQGQSTASCSGG